MKKIIIATKNPGKAKEFKEFFLEYKVEAVSLLDLSESVEDIEETGTTFEANAALKAEQIAKQFKTPVLADDSGLVIDALDGRPGVHSARYAGKPKDDRANTEKVLKELKDITDSVRTARFVCVLAIAAPGKETSFTKGHCEGKITDVPKGSYGFGYDPIFISDGYSKTLAELPPDEKNKISHRKNAMMHLETWLKTLQ